MWTVMCPEQTIHSFPFNSDRQYLLTWLSACWQNKQQHTSTSIVYKYAMSDSRKYHPYPSQRGGEEKGGERRRGQERRGEGRGGEGAQNAKFLQGNITKTWISRGTGGLLKPKNPPWERYGCFLEQHIIKIFAVPVFKNYWRPFDGIYSWVWHSVVNTI